MNCLGIDYGSRRIGLAFSVDHIISPLEVIQNDQYAISRILSFCQNHAIHKVYVGLSTGEFAQTIHIFIDKLRSVLQLPIETVEEAVSTIEADYIFKTNRKKNKNYYQNIESIAAAVILSRAIHV